MVSCPHVKISGAARQLLSEAGDSVESAVGIYFSSQHGNAAASSRASTPQEQLHAIIGPDVRNGEIITLLRDAHNDVQGAVNLYYQRQLQGMCWPLKLALMDTLAFTRCPSFASSSLNAASATCRRPGMS